ncbi:MAG TPA: CDP-alcohol phosphatidyltransferase family protein [Dinghuibacter sp.]|jgi:CDP-diacylglycerol--serine O-phosphatidyltransferase|uniref:CDP-alcohol phosphatidyltransferase family protein n=1 Tax=Dinghuibacter sp. TaxID=2024697 RepID=UPI002BC9821B|nr:CDP-alcohol phosphatidyltransferase family protein [Dinghuibacter sp.]HTJ13556.1 CDP-alcohol phosphatidyltransferase family protein [Dinghuibacter sp.]
MKQIPNIVTLLNLAFGCVAIVCILQPGENIAVLDTDSFLHITLPERIVWGSVFIGCAALVDFLDGFVARLLRVDSPMGKQLDSLADVVSFGVAPGAILYQLLRMSYLREASAFDTSLWAFAPILLFPCAAAYRLGKFNVDARQTYGFLGVPTPPAALLVAALPLIQHFDQFGLAPIVVNKWVLYALTLILSGLMISDIPMLSLKFRTLAFKDNWTKWLLAALAVLAAIFIQWVAVPVVFAVYVILSLVVGKRQNEHQNA